MVNLRTGAPLGLLGIELHTRRRNRVNGRVATHRAGRLELRVDQSFGNCPKYINRRLLEPRTTDRGRGACCATGRLNPCQRALIERADTLFIASAYLSSKPSSGSHGVDVSHRGGRPRFVHIEADGSLAIPEGRANRSRGYKHLTTRSFAHPAQARTLCTLRHTGARRLVRSVP